MGANIYKVFTPSDVPDKFDMLIIERKKSAKKFFKCLNFPTNSQVQGQLGSSPFLQCGLPQGASVQGLIGFSGEGNSPTRNSKKVQKCIF